MQYFNCYFKMYSFSSQVIFKLEFSCFGHTTIAYCTYHILNMHLKRAQNHLSFIWLETFTQILKEGTVLRNELLCFNKDVHWDDPSVSPTNSWQTSSFLCNEKNIFCFQIHLNYVCKTPFRVTDALIVFTNFDSTKLP